jgi:hypothetical protein
VRPVVFIGNTATSFSYDILQDTVLHSCRTICTTAGTSAIVTDPSLTLTILAASNKKYDDVLYYAAQSVNNSNAPSILNIPLAKDSRIFVLLAAGNHVFILFDDVVS